MKIELEKEILEIYFDHIQIEVTGNCNMNCEHCRAANEPRKFIKISEIEKILKFISKVKSENFRIVLSGGEPFLHPQLIEILNLIKKYGIEQIAITTNASLIKNETLKKLNNLNFKNFIIQVSLDSIDEKIHDKFRKYPGAFKKCLNVLKEIKKYQNLVPSIRMTITPETLNQVENMIDFAVEQGVKIIGIGSVIPFGKALDRRYDLSPSEKKQFFQIMSDKHKQFNGKIDVTSEDPLKFLIKDSAWKYENLNYDVDECFFGGCTAGVSTMNISSDGSITPCAMIEDKILNINDYEDINDIIKYYSESEVIKKLLERNFDGPCGKCKFKQICGGCRAQAKAHTNNLYGSDLSCWYAR